MGGGFKVAPRFIKIQLLCLKANNASVPSPP